MASHRRATVAHLVELVDAGRGDADAGDATVERSVSRVTRPKDSILPTTAVMVGGATCSMAASSPCVGPPWFLIEASAAVIVGPRPVWSCWRSRRARRVDGGTQVVGQFERRRLESCGLLHRWHATQDIAISSFDELIDPVVGHADRAGVR